MSTAVMTFSRGSNSAGAPLPHLPRRTSSHSRAVSRTSNTITPSSSLQLVVEPPTPPQRENTDVLIVRPRRMRGHSAIALPTASDLSVQLPFPAPLPAATQTQSEIIQRSTSTESAGDQSLPKRVIMHKSTRSMSAIPTSTSNDSVLVIARPPLRPLKSSLKSSRPSTPRQSALSVVIPALPPSKSEPATPSARAVHFDTHEHVKLFIAQQKPSAVSRDGSPTDDTSGTENEWPAFIYGRDKQSSTSKPAPLRMTLADGPDAMHRLGDDVVLESLGLASDGESLSGRIRVRNLAFEKRVVVRFTFDDWNTTSEVSATYASADGPQHDRFVFTIRLADILPRITERTLFLAVRYAVAGRELWDNNRGRNYRATFARLTVNPPSTAPSIAPQPSPTSPYSAIRPPQRRRRAIIPSLSDEEVADLQDKLEAVARSSGDSAPNSATLDSAENSPLPLDKGEKAFTLDKKSPLGARYNFGRASEAPWARPASPARQPVVQAPGMHTRTMTFPALTGKPAWVSAPVHHRKGLNNVFDGSTIAQGSPRDEEDFSRLPALKRPLRGYFDLPTAQPSQNPNLSPAHRAQSYPPCSPSPSGTPSEGPSSMLVACPVPSKPATFVRSAWSGQSLAIPSQKGVIADSLESTPSVTSCESSADTSPTPSPTNEAHFGMVGARTSPVDETYNQFLDRFCFFTGPGGPAAVAAPADPLQRSHSASSVEDLFSSPPSQWTSPMGTLIVPVAQPPSRPSSCDSIRTITS